MRPAFMRAGVEEFFFHAMPIFRFFPPLWWRCEAFTPSAPVKSLGILCGKKTRPQIMRLEESEPVVTGERNLSRSNKRSRRSTPKASHSDKGRVNSQTKGIKRARAAFQKAL